MLVDIHFARKAKVFRLRGSRFPRSRERHWGMPAFAGMGKEKEPVGEVNRLFSLRLTILNGCHSLLRGSPLASLLNVPVNIRIPSINPQRPPMPNVIIVTIIWTMPMADITEVKNDEYQVGLRILRVTGG